MTGGHFMNPFGFGPLVIADKLIYTGDGNDDVNRVGMAFKPDLTWHFHRTGTTRVRRISDSDRGATTFFSNVSAGSGDQTGANDLQSYIGGGFQVGSGVLNVNADTYGAWGWKKGVAYGFDTVLYSGNDSNRTIAHNLGAVPQFMHFRQRNAGNDSRVYHHENNRGVLPASEFLVLNDFDQSTGGINVWNETDPTSAVFSLGTGVMNQSGDTYVVHLWAAIAGKSFFGRYTGTNLEQVISGLGFQPSMLFVKAEDGGGGNNESSWQCQDALRGSTKRIRLNTTGSESTETQGIKTFDADGFTLGTSNNYNKDGDDYVFGAWK